MGDNDVDFEATGDGDSDVEVVGVHVKKMIEVTLMEPFWLFGGAVPPALAPLEPGVPAAGVGPEVQLMSWVTMGLQKLLPPPPPPPPS